MNSKSVRFILIGMLYVCLNLFSTPLLAEISVPGNVMEQSGPRSGEREIGKPVSMTTDDASLFVDYDNESDRLVVRADNVTLKQLLTMITYETGIEVIFDDAADTLLSIEVDKPKLEEGLKQVLRGTNYMMRYSRDDNQRLMLLGVLVLPEGESDRGSARRLVGLHSEAYYQHGSELSVQEAQAIDMAKLRWQERYADFPQSVQDKLTDYVEKRMRREAVRKQQREERRKYYEEQRAKMKKRHEAQTLKTLESMSDADREQFLKAGEKARKDIEAKLFPNSADGL
jgi:hypothetical protein